jgi:hypothetical protein
MVSYRFTHPPLDAVPFMSFADHLAHRQADPRASAQSRQTGGCNSVTRGKKPCHRGRELLARSLVNPLIVCVLAQPRISG